MGINKLKVSPTRELSLISFTKKPNRNIYKKNGNTRLFFFPGVPGLEMLETVWRN